MIHWKGDMLKDALFPDAAIPVHSQNLGFCSLPFLFYNIHILFMEMEEYSRHDWVDTEACLGLFRLQIKPCNKMADMTIEGPDWPVH